MGPDFNWLEVVVSVVLAYSVLKLELAYQRRQANKAWVPRPAARTLTVREKSVTRNSAEAVRCGKCNLYVKDYVAYTDGDRWCLPCDTLEEG